MAFFFDIEAGGLLGTQSSILSIAYGTPEQGVAEPLVAAPTEGSRLYRWSREQVWKPIQQRSGKNLQTEEQILSQFISVLESTPRGNPIIGWNIGYFAEPIRAKDELRGFDLPTLATRAQKYGLLPRLQQTMAGRQVRDIGQEYAVIAARTALKHRDLLDESVYEQAVGFQKALGVAGIDLSETQRAARFASAQGIRFAGWKQELMYEIMEKGKQYQAHIAEQDVRAGLRLATYSEAQIEETIGTNIRRWNRGVVRNKILSSLRYGVGEKRQFKSVADIAAKIERYGLQDEIAAGIEQLSRTYGINKSIIEAGKGIGDEAFDIVKGGHFFTPTKGFAGKAARELFAIGMRNKVGLGIAAGVGVAALLKPGSWFSGKDDAWNVIEGLPERGMAGANRKINTDFGSGYQGDDISNSVLILGGLGLASNVSVQKRLFGFQRVYHGTPSEDIAKSIKISGLRSSFGGTGAASISKKYIEASRKNIHVSLVKPYARMYAALNQETIEKLKENSEKGFKTLIKRVLTNKGHVVSADIPYSQWKRFSPDLDQVDEEWQKFFAAKSKENIDPQYISGSKSFNYLKHLKSRITNIPSYITKHPLRFGSGLISFGIGVGLAGYGLKNLFSGKDDNYNTIEGLPERGMAGASRFTNTDFGSGYRGLKIGAGLALGGTATYLSYLLLTGEEYEDIPETFGWSFPGDRKTPKQEFAFFRRSLKKYGEKVGTGHKRILIPRSILTEEELTKELGFVSVRIAVPEAGETSPRTFRHPKNTYHIHEHGDVWSMHKDRHAAATMLMMSSKNMAERVGHFVSGAPHAILEGIPGVYEYAKGQIFGTATMRERLLEETSIEYWKSLARFSGFDDNFNTIEGLSERGLAGANRKRNTDFGSGYQGLSFKSVLKGFLASNTGKTIGGALALSTGIGLATDSFGAGYQTFGGVLGGASIGALKGGTKGGIIGGIVGGLAFGALGSLVSDTGPVINLALGAVTTSVAASLFSAGMLRGGIFYRDTIKMMKGFGLNIEDMADIYKSTQGMDILGPTGFAVQGSTILKANASSIKHLGIIGKTLDKVSSFMQKNPRFIRYLDAAFGSPALLDLATSAGGIEKATGGQITKAIGQDILEGVPLGIGAGALGLLFSSKEDANTIKGLQDRGLAGANRKRNTDFGSGYQDSETSDSVLDEVFGIGIGAGAGTISGFSLYSKFRISNYLSDKKYPRLSKMRKYGRRGFRMLSEEWGDVFTGKLQPPTTGAKAIKEVFRLLKPVSSFKDLDRFKGLVYMYDSEGVLSYLDLPKTEQQKIQKRMYLANLQDPLVGPEKMRTYEYLRKKGFKAQPFTVSAEKIVHDENIFDRVLKYLGGSENVVIKEKRGVLSQGVWFGMKALEADEHAFSSFGLAPEDFLIQRKLDLAEEFRVVTVGDKPIYSAYRWGTSGAKKTLSAAEKFFPKLAQQLREKHILENTIPVLNTQTKTGLEEFASSIAKLLPYEIGAFDIGLTKSGEFQLIEAQRGFGTLKHPYVAERLLKEVTGKFGIFSKIAIGAAAIGTAGLAYGAYNLFSGKDDEYNTIEGLREEGIASTLRKQNTDFGSGWDALRGLTRAFETFGMMRRSKEFQRALKNAVEVERLGTVKGWGDVRRMKTTFRGKEFEFIRKQGLGKNELSVMKKMEGSYGPSIYRTGEDVVDMELFHGVTFDDLPADYLKTFLPEAKRSLSVLHKKGFMHNDAHLGNVMLAKDSQNRLHIGLIDYGEAKPLTKFGKKLEMEDDLVESLQRSAEAHIKFGAAEMDIVNRQIYHPQNLASSQKKQKWWHFHKLSQKRATGNMQNSGSRSKTKGSIASRGSMVSG